LKSPLRLVRLGNNNSELTAHLNSGIPGAAGLVLRLSLSAIAATAFVSCGCEVRTPPPVGREGSEQQLSVTTTISEADCAIRVARERSRLTTHISTPWELIHAALAFGMEYEVPTDSHRRTTIAAYLFEENGPPVFERWPDGIRVRRSPRRATSEQHRFQFLAYFAQTGVIVDQELFVDGQSYRVRDLVNSMKWELDCREDSACGLIAAAAYIEPREIWRNQFGEELSLQKLIQHELEIPRDVRRKSLCWGTHSLFAIAFSVTRAASHSTMKDVLTNAQELLDAEVAGIRRSQAPDGTFVGDEAHSDVVDRLHFTGHSLEWLVLWLNPAELRSEWITRTVRALADVVQRHSADPLPPEVWFHLLHALRMYREKTTPA
jgi:hypothetical protein